MPARFVNYQEPLGQGGFAIAYLVIADRGELLVAKQFSPNPLKLGTRIDQTVLDDLRESFGQEGERHKELVHSNIVRAVDSLLLDGYPTLLVKYLPFCLDRWLGSIHAPKSLTLFEAVDVIEQLAVALDYLQTGYREGVLIHKDVKADNVFVDWDNTVKLNDLGIASLLHQYGNAGVRVAFTGIEGPVVAPEGRIARVTTAASDSWALGLLFLHILSGQCPSTAAITAWLHNPNRIQQWVIQNSIPPDALALVNTMLADPSQRSQPLQIRTLLSEWRRQEGSPMGIILRANDQARACMERSKDYVEDAMASDARDYISRIGAYRQALAEIEHAIQHRTTEQQQCKCIPFWVRLVHLRNIVGKIELERGNREQAVEEFSLALNLMPGISEIGLADPWLEREIAISARMLRRLIPDPRQQLELQRSAVVSQWQAAKVCPSPAEIRLLHDDLVMFDQMIERSLSTQPEIVSDDVRATRNRFQKRVSRMMGCLVDRFMVRQAFTIHGQSNADYEISAIDLNENPIQYLEEKVEFVVTDTQGNAVRQTKVTPQEYTFRPQDRGKIWVNVTPPLEKGNMICVRQPRNLMAILHADDGNQELVFGENYVFQRMLVTIHDETGKWAYNFQGRVRLFAMDNDGHSLTDIQIVPQEISLGTGDFGKCNVSVSIPSENSKPYHIMAEIIDRDGKEISEDFAIIWTSSNMDDEFTILNIY